MAEGIRARSCSRRSRRSLTRQRQAVTMAFLEDMTHQEVARALDVPLGTAKTRIRSGLQTLRGHLTPLAASLLGVGLAIVGFRYVQIQADQDRDERALTLVTTSDLVPLRLTPSSAGVPATAHANYRGRAGTPLAVLTTERLPAPPPGRAYAAWVRHGDVWTAPWHAAPRRRWDGALDRRGCGTCSTTRCGRNHPGVRVGERDTARHRSPVMDHAISHRAKNG